MTDLLKDFTVPQLWMLHEHSWFVHLRKEIMQEIRRRHSGT